MSEKILRTSLERGWIVTIMYQDDKGNITKRNIKVLSIDSDKVTVHCYLRDQVRIFHIDNILAADYCREKKRPA